MNKFHQLIQEWGRRSLGDILAEQFRRFKVWWLKTSPNPWPEELDEAVERNDSKMICPCCSTPQSDRAWFCPKCGAAVGPYNNTMPFLNIFSTGEMLRAGTGSRLKKSPLVVVGFLLVGLTQYLLFAPLFLYRFVKNWYHPGIEGQEDGGENGPSHPSSK